MAHPEASDPLVQLNHIAEPVAEFALMTDGVEVLAIQQSTGAPHPRFMEHVLSGLRQETLPGRSTAWCEWLGRFLTEEIVISRTDDDKTLVLATRIPKASDGAADR